MPYPASTCCGGIPTRALATTSSGPGRLTAIHSTAAFGVIEGLRLRVLRAKAIIDVHRLAAGVCESAGYSARLVAVADHPAVRIEGDATALAVVQEVIFWRHAYEALPGTRHCHCSGAAARVNRAQGTRNTQMSLN